MQVTETVVAAAIRLNVRMRELEEVMDLYDDFSRTCQREYLSRRQRDCLDAESALTHSYG